MASTTASSACSSRTHICVPTCSPPPAAPAPSRRPRPDTVRHRAVILSRVLATSPDRTTSKALRVSLFHRGPPCRWPRTSLFSTLHELHLPIVSSSRRGRYCLSKTGRGHLSWETQASVVPCSPGGKSELPSSQERAPPSSRWAHPLVPPHLPTLCTSATENTPCPLHIARYAVSPGCWRSLQESVPA